MTHLANSRTSIKMQTGKIMDKVPSFTEEEIGNIIPRTKVRGF
jgi:hypothetical protein